MRSSGSGPFVLSGELDLACAAEFERAVFQHAGGSSGDVVLDCTLLWFIDSSGLRALIELKTGLERDGRGLVLKHLGPECRRVFTITGVEELFGLAGSG